MDTVILHLDDVEKPWVHRVNKATEFVTIERAVPNRIRISDFSKSVESWGPAFETGELWFELDYYDANLMPHYKQCAGPPKVNPWAGFVNTNSVTSNGLVAKLMQEVYSEKMKQMLQIESSLLATMKGKSLNVIDS